LTVVYKRTYLYPVEVEWDPGKAASNYAKHQVTFADAVGVLEDDLALTIRDPGIADEERSRSGWTGSEDYWLWFIPGEAREFGSSRRDARRDARKVNTRNCDET
jgi:hypothetical protein